MAEPRIDMTVIDAHKAGLIKALGEMHDTVVRDAFEPPMTAALQRLGAIENATAAKQKEHDALVTEIASLKAERVALTAEVATLAQQRDAIKGQLPALEKKVLDLQATHRDLVSKMTATMAAN